MAGDDVKIKIKVDGDTKNYDKAIDKSQKKTSKLSDTAEAVGLKLNPALIGATAAAAGFAAVIGSVQAASAFEDIAVQFEVLTGSAKESKRVVSELQDFAAGTPFQFEGIADATKQLLGFGFTSDEALEKLRPLGDVAAALGTPLTDLSLIFGQVSSAGKLTGERLTQLQEKSVPIVDALAKVMDKPREAISGLVSQGKVDFATFEQAFASISEKGGLAFEGMERKSKTLSGQISTLKDNIKILSAEFGRLLVPILKSATGELVEFIGNIRELANPSLYKKIGDVANEIKKLEEEIGRLEGRRLGRVRLKQLKDELEEQKALKAQYLAEANIAEDENNTQSVDKAKAKADAEKAILAEVASFEADLQKSKTEELSILKEEELNQKLEALAAEQEAINEQKILNDAAELEKKGQHAEALKLIEKQIADNRKKSIIKELKDRKKADEELKKADEANLKMKQASANAIVAIASNAAQLEANIGAKKNKIVFLLSKAAAMAQAYVSTELAATNALAQIPAPFNIAASGAIRALGYANIAAIAGTAIQGLAEGGIVGGIAGTDVNPAMLTRGELVSPVQNFDEVIGSVRAQRNAEELAEEGGIGAGGASEVLIGFTDDAFEIIEQKLLERRAIGAGSL